MIHRKITRGSVVSPFFIFNDWTGKLALGIERPNESAMSSLDTLPCSFPVILAMAKKERSGLYITKLVSAYLDSGI